MYDETCHHNENQTLERNVFKWKGKNWVYVNSEMESQHFSYLSMLGCDSRFMSWTSLSMLALLLARMFIFRAITWPDTRCCTWMMKGKGAQTLYLDQLKQRELKSRKDNLSSQKHLKSASHPGRIHDCSTFGWKKYLRRLTVNRCMAEESRRAAQRWWWRIYHTCISHTINTLWSNKNLSADWMISGNRPRSI